MDILVTGTAGFIGSHVAEYLKQQGHTVTGFAQQLPVVALDKNIVGDLRERNLADRLQAEGRADCIHHVGANSTTWDPSPGLLETNVGGTQQMLEYARRCDARFVFSSSSAVYGNTPAPYREDSELQPTNNYSLSKMVGERLVEAYVKTYGLKAVVFRYFNTYGIREDRKGKTASMVYHFLAAALKKGEVQIYGDGTQKRDFVCVLDTVKMHEKAMAFARGFDVFNCGSGAAISYTALVELIGKVIGRTVNIVYVQNPIKGGYQLHTEADMGKAKELLGYAPETPLEKGIAWMAGHYSQKGVDVPLYF